MSFDRETRERQNLTKELRTLTNQNQELKEEIEFMRADLEEGNFSFSNFC